jgi:hypothetical protein
MNLSRFKSYSIKKLKGCRYRVELLDKKGKKVATLVNTPRFWILFAKDLRDTIAKTRFEPVCK